MGERTVQVEVFEKIGDLYRKHQSLKPAWLRESGEAVDADRVFIWGKGARQPPYKRERSATNLKSLFNLLIRFSLDFTTWLKASWKSLTNKSA